MTIRTRFAPSPTGYLHIGNVRTALFNFLLSRHYGGEFLLRIEDTDQARHNEDAVRVILDGLKWLGLDWDQKPVRQSENLKRHQDVALQLVEKGMAYYCYLNEEETDQAKTKAKEANKAFKSPWRDKDASQAPADRKGVVRLKTPLDGDQIVSDLVQGDVRVANDQVEDFVLLRSDGSPTYMLSVVVDDHDMAITHVVRGDDHLTNTFKQLLIYKAMGWDLPKFAHMPMILGEDGTKLSKRKGALGLHDYMAEGYLPEAFANYLMRLGWGHGDEEIITMEQAIDWFDFDGINKSAAQINMDKLNFLNAHYIKQADAERLADLILEHYPTLPASLNEKVAKSRLITGIEGLKERGDTIKEIAKQAHFYFKARPLPVVEDAAPILDDEARKVMASLIDALKTVDDFSADGVQDALKSFVKDQNLKFKDVGMPLRVSLTGTKSSPSVNEIAAALGREETLKRLEDVVMKQNTICTQAA